MPYNNTPIAPPQDNQYTGETKLPLARVKKIIAADDDIGACAATSAFAITIAAEMFIQHLVDSTHTVVKGEKRPRRTINYRDVAAAVAKFDELEFLSDVVPRQVPFRQYVARKGRVRGDAPANGLGARAPFAGEAGERMDVDGDARLENGAARAQDEDEEERVRREPVVQLSPRSQRTGPGTRFDVVSEEVRAPDGEEA